MIFYDSYREGPPTEMGLAGAAWARNFHKPYLPYAAAKRTALLKPDAPIRRFL